MVEQNCTLFPDAPEKCTAISAVKKTFGAFSFLGSLFIIVIVLLFRKYRYFEQRLILYLGIASFFSAFAYMGDLYPEHDRSKLCVLEAWWLTFFGHSVLAWVSCITCNLYFSTVRKTDTTKFEKFYIPIAWGLPFIVASLPLFGNHYGPADMWCWIRRDTENAMVWRFTTWYMPLFAIILVMIVVYTYIFFVLRRQVKSWDGMYSAEAEESKELMNKHIKPLRFYPFIYLALSVFPLIHRIHNAVSTEPSFPLLLLHTMSNPLVGVANGIVFGMDRATLSRLNYVQMKSALLSWLSPRKQVVNEYPVQPAEDTTNHKADEPPLPGSTLNPQGNPQGRDQGTETSSSRKSLDDKDSPRQPAASETGNENKPEVSNGTNATITGSTEFEDVSLE